VRFATSYAQEKIAKVQSDGNSDGQEYDMLLKTQTLLAERLGPVLSQLDAASPEDVRLRLS
jgi:hypothetical protein